MKNKARGFTLIETIIALFLSSIIFAATAALFFSMVSSQFGQIYRQRAQGDALLAAKAMTNEIEAANNVQVLLSSTGVAGCRDFSSKTGAAMSANCSDDRFFFCLSGGTLYSQHDSVATCYAPGADPCGNLSATYAACPGSAAVLVSNVAAGSPNLFTLAGNTVGIHFTVTKSSITESINTAVNFEDSAN